MTTVLVNGKDPSLRDREVQRVIDELLGSEDRSFALDDHAMPNPRARSDSEEGSDDDGGSGESADVPAFNAVTNALSSPPFMTACRVVVVREIGNLVGDQGKWLAGWVADPLDAVHLVLVSGGGRTPAALDKAVKAHGQVVAPVAEKTADVLQHQLADTHIKLAPAAAARVAEHLGEDAGRVPELVELWHSAYGDDVVLDIDDVDQYLGDLGTAGRYDLTNAIDDGDLPRALEALHRMMSTTSAAQPRPLHPMQIMASLSFHYQRMLRLDHPEIVTSEQAADVLGLTGRSRYGARVALRAAKNLRTEGLREAMRLLANAELDLRGASGLDERMVTEVLIARLAALSRRHARTR